MRVEITGEMRQEAGDFERLSYDALRQSYSTTPRIHGRFYNVRLAELAFAAACRERGLTPRWLGNLEGQRNVVDYRVASPSVTPPAGDATATAMHSVDVIYLPPPASRFVYNCWEFSRRQADIFVLVRHGEQAAELLAWVTREDVMHMPLAASEQDAAFHYAPLNLTRPMLTLWREMGVPFQEALL